MVRVESKRPFVVSSKSPKVRRRTSAQCNGVGAALRGGLVNALVVDIVHADALMDDALFGDAAAAQ